MTPRKRYAIGADGDLTDAAGEVVGRVVSLTIEWGVKGGGSSPSGNNNGGKQETLGGGAGGGGIEPPFDGPAEIWAHYVEVMNPRVKTLAAQERAVIREAMKVAADDPHEAVAVCKRAIDGCKASNFHMGQNDRQKKYNRITHILKGKRGTRTTREQIDLFLEIADRSGIQSGFTSADPARVGQAKRDVLDAYEFPGDEGIQRRGDEARSWLVEKGWTIGATDEGRPTFTPPGGPS